MKSKNFILIICMVVLATPSSYGQLQANNWIINTGIALRFLPQFSVSTNVGIFPPLTWGKSNVALSEGVHGRLILYGGADPGINQSVSPTLILNDSENNQMHSEPLHGTASTSQSYVVLNSPDNCNQYIILGLVAQSSIPSENGTLAYNILDTRLNGGLGDIVAPYNRIVLRTPLNEGMAVTIHANKKDYYVIGSIKSPDNSFFVIPVNGSGPDVKKIVYSTDKYEKPFTGNIFSISPNSGYIYTQARKPQETSVYLFDNFTGKIRHYFLLGETKDENGVLLSQKNIEPGAGEFSQDSKHLYIILKKPAQTLLHIDILQKKHELISLTTYPNHLMSLRSIRLAPDTCIYLLSNGSVINNQTNEIGIYRLNYRGTGKPVVDQVRLIKSSEIPGPVKTFQSECDFPQYSNHIFDAQYKRIPTACDLPIITYKIDTSICVNQWSELDVNFISNSFPNTIYWNAEKAFISQSSDKIFRTKFLQTGIYNVWVKVCNVNGCDSVAYTVNVVEAPLVNAGNTTTLCRGQSIHLGSEDTVRYASYEWTPRLYIDNYQSPNPLCSPDSTIRYYLTVRNSAGCSAVDSVLIIVDDTLIVDASNDTSICAGKPLILRVEGADEYEWSPPELFNNPFSNTPTVMLKQNTTLYVKGKKNGCEGYDTIHVTIMEKPNLSIQVPKNKICKSDTLQLFVKGGDRYEWSPPQYIDNPHSATPRIFPKESQYFYVTAYANGCSAHDSVYIAVDENPEITFTGNQDVCLGESTVISFDGADAYEWIPDIYVDNFRSASPVITPEKSIQYMVRAYKGSCIVEKQVNVNVVDPKEKIFEIVTDDTTLFSPNEIYSVIIRIPAGVQKYVVAFSYDQSSVFVKRITHSDGIKIIQHTGGYLVISSELLLSEKTDIILECLALLPPNGRTQEHFSLEVIESIIPCASVKKVDNFIRYNQICGWQFRGVAPIGEFGISYLDNNLRISTGYGGIITTCIFNIYGEMVWSKRSMYSHSESVIIPLPDLPSGAYIVRIDNGVWYRDNLFLR